MTSLRESRLGTGEIKSFEWGDHRIKSLALDDNYLSNFSKGKMLPSKRLSEQQQDNDDENQVIEVSEIILEKGSKTKPENIDKKNNKKKKSRTPEEIAVPDDPGVIEDEDIHEP